ncbi:type VII toxin-antitoxin system HepT family RNase toxin [Effusibacillus lacus]|uniref:DUF86 domain-containing protein n=1 Tax=Effusibacillus lacus TaxID=1348429 RepID=A0A292YHR8_9BACL|nr:DUF86 domain-containing protein [Effusibacillus lacus]TCS76460.1 uncharacterized protein YutE (UPF0331/DUF86 family) [Effusibacillus lacus]GAX90517.1 hypothetical protein EFBL_2144 [Effusibacillus lacus]
MVEKEVIARRLVLLEEYLSDLDEIREKTNWDHFSQDKLTRRFVERTLHIAIEACLDIANHIISYEGYREPKSNKDTFEILEEQHIIDKNLAEKLKKMAQFRNVIVHDYVTIQEQIVYAVLVNHVQDIADFGKIVTRKYL